jgi:hypothetical protein
MEICKSKAVKKLDNEFKSGHLYKVLSKVTGETSLSVFICVRTAGSWGLFLNYVDSGDVFMQCRYCKSEYIDVTDNYCLQEKG